MERREEVSIKTFLVGGAVRDRLLGVSPKDRDYLVLDSSNNEMIEQGFHPVGKSHLIFLHPETNEEYSLGRDLKSDLCRRDLTINAMAQYQEKVIDYFGGLKDLKNKVIRHVRDENFFTDPLRIYRTASLKARFPDFSIHPDTLKLMNSVAKTSSFQNLNQERIFSEISKALKYENAFLFFEILKQTHVLPVHFTELSELTEAQWTHVMNLLKETSRMDLPSSLRFATLFVDFDHINLARKMLKRLSLPNDWVRTALIATLFHERLKNVFLMSASDIVKIFYVMDAYRTPYLVQALSFLARADNRSLHGRYLEECFRITSEINFGNIDQSLSGKEIALAIRQERILAIQKSINFISQ